MGEISIAPFYRILKNAGAQRVSDDAAKELCETVETLAEELASEVVKVAKHANRKTIKPEDIDLIAK
ncbi:MAG: histone family protein [Candidatus Aenigmarchaeota archaeon]|nr:histone family protein [Candidatus Aenigmarchaeota archaeon]